MSAAACAMMVAAAGAQLGVSLQDTVTGSVTSFSPGPRSVTSPSVTASPTAGVAPYSYTWTRLSGDAGISATSPSAGTTSFTASLDIGEAARATFGVAVTDSGGSPSAHDQILVTLENRDLR